MRGRIGIGGARLRQVGAVIGQLIGRRRRRGCGPVACTAPVVVAVLVLVLVPVLVRYVRLLLVLELRRVVLVLVVRPLAAAGRLIVLPLAGRRLGVRRAGGGVIMFVMSKG